jgi:hypothetical protein
VMQELLHLAAVEPGNNVVECTLEGSKVLSLMILTSCSRKLRCLLIQTCP